MKNLLKEKVTQDFIKTSFGNIVEWYDFAIYGLFAVQISNNFFPTKNHFISLLLVFLTFGVGFLARPFGSIVFGKLGDKFGKHYSVNITIWCMAVPTSLIGILPNYHSIGIMAPILLIILRICQGVSAGGQFSGLITIAVESGSSNKSFLVSVVYAVSVIGAFVASFIGFVSVSLISYVNSESIFIKSLAWRIPFILSSVLFLIYLKLKPEYSKHTSEDFLDKIKLSTIFKQQPYELISMLILSATSLTIYYVLFTYLISYMQIHLNFSKSNSFSVMNIILLISIIMYPIFGYFAGKVNCRIKSAQTMSLVIALATGIFSFAYLNIWFGIIGLILMVVAFCGLTAYTTSFFAEIFAKKYRMTACSFSFNTGVAVSGFAPLMAELFTKLSVIGLPCLLIATSCIICLVLKLVKQTQGYKNILLN